MVCPARRLEDDEEIVEAAEALEERAERRHRRRRCAAAGAARRRRRSGGAAPRRRRRRSRGRDDGGEDAGRDGRGTSAECGRSSRGQEAARALRAFGRTPASIQCPGHARAAAAARAGQRALRSRPVLPHRAARAWSTSRPRSRRAATASRSSTCASRSRSRTTSRLAVPALVGIAGMHALETDAVRALAAEVAAPRAARLHRRRRPHRRGVSRAVPHRRRRRRLRRRWRADAAAAGRRARARASLDEVPGPGRCATPSTGVRQTHGDDRHAEAGRCAAAGAASRRRLAPPLRLPRAPADVARSRRRAAVRSAARSARSGSCTTAAFASADIDAVCRDFASVGDHIFVADDLFWHHPSRSLALAEELKRRGVRKQWILVQSRVDIVARHPELLEAWKPIAREFDVFFGLEAATNEGLKGLVKDTTVDRTAEGIDVARRLGYGVTGNFVIDPDWSEADFERLWAFVEQSRAVAGGLHHPHAAARHRLLPRAAAAARRDRVGAVRHAPPAVGAAARRRAASTSSIARRGAARC